MKLPQGAFAVHMPCNEHCPMSLV